jgi:plastocyanin
MLFWSTLVWIALLLVSCAPQAAKGQAPVQTNQVTMPPSYRFDPPLIQVKIGDTVTWTNKDNFTHDVHLLGDINWVSQPLRPGDSASYTFKQAGQFPYLCDFHAHDMKGEVIVVAK